MRKHSNTRIEHVSGYLMRSQLAVCGFPIHQCLVPQRCLLAAGCLVQSTPTCRPRLPEVASAMVPLLTQLNGPEGCQLWEAPAAKACAGMLTAFGRSLQRQGTRPGSLWVGAQALQGEGLPSWELPA